MLVRRGDRIVLTGKMTPAVVSVDGVHRIGCTLPELFADAKPGQRVTLDDGKIGGVVTAVGDGELTLEVLSAGATATKLRAEKGINVPDTRLSISPLTVDDIENLEYVKSMPTLSACRSAKCRRCQRPARPLDRAADHSLDIVLKIETVAAFESSPQVLLELMWWENDRHHDRPRRPGGGSRL